MTSAVDILDFGLSARATFVEWPTRRGQLIMTMRSMDDNLL